MILRTKRDTEQYLRERTVTSIQDNKYLQEGDWISTPYFSYVVTKEETETPLKNELYAKMLPFPLATDTSKGWIQVGKGLIIEDGVIKHPDTHPAIMIDEDPQHRFVTDVQIKEWNSLPNKAYIERELDKLKKGMTWKDPVPTFEDIAKVYPKPKDTWTVITLDTNEVYVYDAEEGKWVYLSQMVLPPLASKENNGLMSKEHFTKLEDLGLASYIVDGLLSKELFKKLNDLGLSNPTTDGLMSKEHYSKLEDLGMASDIKDGLMSKEHFTKLDNLSLDTLYFTDERPVLNPIGGISKGTIFNDTPMSDILEDVFFKEKKQYVDIVYYGATSQTVSSEDDLGSLSSAIDIGLPFKFNVTFNDNKLIILFKDNFTDGSYILKQDISISQLSEGLKELFNLPSELIDLTFLFDISEIKIGKENYIQLISKPIIHSGEFTFSLGINGDISPTIKFLVEEIEDIISKKEYWDSKAEGIHTHTTDDITDFPDFLPNEHRLDIYYNGEKQISYTGAEVKELDITPANINAYSKNEIDDKVIEINKEINDKVIEINNEIDDKVIEINKELNTKSDKGHTHTKSEITDFPVALKNPNSLTIQANDTSLGVYDGSTAKILNITATNVGAYTKAETDSKLNTKLNLAGGSMSGNLTNTGYIKAPYFVCNVNSGIQYVNSAGTNAWLINHNTSDDAIWIGATNNTRPVKCFSTLTVSGTITGAKIYNAVWNDYAEFFERGEDTEAGDIIALDIYSDEEKYVKATKDNNLIVGVHSNSFAHLIGGENPVNGEDYYEYNIKKYIPIGLAGRVKCKVIGKINKGDYITISDIAGIGIVSHNFNERIVGIALENKHTEDIGLVKILIKI